VEIFFNVPDARRKLHLWRRDYNHHRPHSALVDRTRQSTLPRSVLEKTAMKPPWKTLRVSHFPNTTTVGIIAKKNHPSTKLLEALT
jgi:Integrase core domain